MERAKRKKNNFLSKKNIISHISEKFPLLNKKQIEDFINTFYDILISSLIENNKIEIRKFGTFFIKELKEKKSARNPKTGEIIYVPPKKKLRFTPSKYFKKEINKI